MPNNGPPSLTKDDHIGADKPVILRSPAVQKDVRVVANNNDNNMDNRHTWGYQATQLAEESLGQSFPTRAQYGPHYDSLPAILQSHIIISVSWLRGLPNGVEGGDKEDDSRCQPVILIWIRSENMPERKMRM